LHQMARTRYVSPLTWAIALGADPEAKLRWLARALDEHDANVAFMNTDPMGDVFRSDARTLALLDRLGLPRVTRRT
jgi:hypothetical protein